MGGGADPLLRHIRHAEEWLGRARLDWRRGNAPAAMLRLMLAEAEIRHARETGMAAVPGADPTGTTASTPAARGGSSWPKVAAAIAAAAVLAGGLGYASMRPEQQGALVERAGSAVGLRGESSRTIVRLDSGQFLLPDREQAAGVGPNTPEPSTGDAQPFQFAVPAVPVDLKTPSPTF
ncbi:MAG TPA: hypothetical protein VFL28_10290 [bacterium]|nr:hypothetical protein [bacterium]